MKQKKPAPSESTEPTLATVHNTATHVPTLPWVNHTTSVYAIAQQTHTCVSHATVPTAELAPAKSARSSMKAAPSTPSLPKWVTEVGTEADAEATRLRPVPVVVIATARVPATALIPATALKVTALAHPKATETPANQVGTRSPK